LFIISHAWLSCSVWKFSRNTGLRSRKNEIVMWQLR